MKVPTLMYVTASTGRDIVMELYKADALTDVFPCEMLAFNSDTMTVGGNVTTMLVRRTPNTPAAFVDANEDRIYQTTASFPGSEQEFTITVTVRGRAASTESAIIKASPDAMEILISMMEEQ